MRRARLHNFPLPSSEERMNRLTHFSPLAASLPFLAMGCAQFGLSPDPSAGAVHVARASGVDAVEWSASRGAATLPDMDPPTNGASPIAPRSLAITLDTVFRLAED